MEEGVVRSRFGHFRSFLEVCVVVFVTHVVPFFDKSHFLITVACSHFSMRGAEISFFPQPLLKLLKVGLQSLQMGSVAPMKSPYVT